MAVAEGTQARFEIGRVVSRTFGAIGNNVLTFTVLSLVPGIPAAFMYWSLARFSADAAVPSRVFNFPAAAGTGTGALAYFIAAFVFQAAVVHGTVAYLNGKRASVADCLSTGLSHFFPLLLMSILVGLGVLAGMLLFLVPGLILAVTWSVAVPARVVERLNITDSLKRSRELTHGHRWAVFGLLALFFFLGFLIRRVLGALSVVALLFTAPPAAAGAQPDVLFSPAYIVISTLAAMISITMGAASVASMYYELRLVKEGIGPEALAAVFD